MEQLHTETTALESAARDHRELRESLREIGRFIEENPLTPAAPGSTGASRALASVLSGLYVRLQRHFHDEEQSGLPDILLAGVPHIIDCVARLRGEHARILAELHALIAATERFAHEGSPFDLHIREWMERLLQLVSRHEDEESVRIDATYHTEVQGRT